MMTYAHKSLIAKKEWNGIAVVDSDAGSDRYSEPFCFQALDKARPVTLKSPLTG